MNRTTQTICNRRLTLVVGRRYQTSRPIAGRGRQLFPIFIRDITGSCDDLVEVLEGFTYDESNEFLEAFNNGKVSFDGRIW